MQELRREVLRRSATPTCGLCVDERAGFPRSAVSSPELRVQSHDMRSRGLIAAGVTVLLTSFACGWLPHGEPVDIVFVTWDSTRADHLSAYGYPRPDNARARGADGRRRAFRDGDHSAQLDQALLRVDIHLTAQLGVSRAGHGTGPADPAGNSPDERTRWPRFITGILYSRRCRRSCCCAVVGFWPSGTLTFVL